MSNNPFLKSKESNKNSNNNSNKTSNNRFQFLEPDEADNKTLKKEKKISSKYDSTDNSFTKPSIRREDRREYNNYRNRPPQKKPEPIKEVTIDITTEYFPDLVPAKTESSELSEPSIKQSKLYVNFKDIVNTRIQEEIIIETDIVNPGWVKISKSKTSNELIWKYGPSTEYTIKVKKQEELENNINYCMNKAIETMKERWDKYEKEYDEINGEGAYAEKFRSSPVYGPEYDTESDDEDEIGEQYIYDGYDGYDN